MVWFAASLDSETNWLQQSPMATYGCQRTTEKALFFYVITCAAHAHKPQADGAKVTEMIQIKHTIEMK